MYMHFTWSNNISDAEIRNSTVFHKPLPTDMEVVNFMHTYMYMYMVIHNTMQGVCVHVHVDISHKAVKLKLVCKIFH